MPASTGPMNVRGKNAYVNIPSNAAALKAHGFASLLRRKAFVPLQDSEPVEFSLGWSSVSDARHEVELRKPYES
jgi:hypothetical protein